MSRLHTSNKHHMHTPNSFYKPEQNKTIFLLSYTKSMLHTQPFTSLSPLLHTGTWHCTPLHLHTQLTVQDLWTSFYLTEEEGYNTTTELQINAHKKINWANNESIPIVNQKQLLQNFKKILNKSQGNDLRNNIWIMIIRCLYHFLRVNLYCTSNLDQKIRISEFNDIHFDINNGCTLMLF